MWRDQGVTSLLTTVLYVEVHTRNSMFTHFWHLILLQITCIRDLLHRIAAISSAFKIRAASNTLSATPQQHLCSNSLVERAVTNLGLHVQIKSPTLYSGPSFDLYAYFRRFGYLLEVRPSTTEDVRSDI
jgi:hypothetical protein